MIINVLEPNGSVSNAIPLRDIDHVETHTLSFFGKKAHNLYVMLKKEDGGHFYLLSYVCPYNMERAEKKLYTLLHSAQKGSSSTQDVVLELVPSAAPADDRSAQVAL